MAYPSALLDRMLSHQHASTSSSFLRDVRPRLYSRPQRRARVVVASLTQAPSRSAAADLPQVARKEQNSGPARIFLTSTRAAAGQLWGVMKFFQAEQAAEVSSETDSSVLGDAAKRAKQAEKVQDKAKSKKEKEPAADISKYLRATGLMETRYVRMVANLCAQTYYMEKLSKESLWRRHRLHLITTSRLFKNADSTKSAQEMLTEGDGMVSSPREVQRIKQEVVSPTKLQHEAQPREAAMAALARKLEPEPKKPKQTSPADLVQQGLAAAAAAAAHAAAPFASFGNAVPFRAVTSRMQSAAAAGQSTAVATIATVTAAVSSNFNKEHGKAPKGVQAADPTQWFVCDDPVSHTRYFVIQGSETLDHWRVNLSFDPVVFEDKALGVKVHRGVYTAAEVLYERFLPMVEEHLTSSPFAKIAFTGHSLGGSLGTLLLMMYKHRGVLPQAAVAPVYTFGAPAIFCEGACGKPCNINETCDVDLEAEAAIDSNKVTPDTSATEPVTDNNGHLKSKGIMQALGLEAGCVRNIFMNKDIVPRAFACDYTLVADLLRRVGEGFREHDCLMGNGRVVMYFFVGKMMVLQPDRDLRFIYKDEPYHNMLPQEPGLWVLRQPSEAALSHRQTPSLAAMADGQLADAGHAAVKTLDKPKGKASQSMGSSKGSKSNQSAHSHAPAPVSKAPVALAETKKGQPAASLREAVMEMMNYPHPLDTLSEPGAYGPEGAISRYHNPDHYCRAIGAVLKAKTKPIRMNFRSARWFEQLQEKERVMKRKVRSLRHARHERAQKQQHQMQLHKKPSQPKAKSPPTVIQDWRRAASQHAG